MAEIHRTITNRGVLLTAPSRPPEITLWRVDTWAITHTSEVMTHRGNAVWSFTIADDGIDRAGQIDADPASSGQVTKSERYHDLNVNGVQNQIIEVTVPAIPADVWVQDLSTGFDSGIALSGEQLVAARQFATNRTQADPGDPGTFSWYNDDKLTIRFTMPLLDHTGAAVLGVAGVPARRGHVVVVP